jgi:hypothetical protein
MGEIGNTYKILVGQPEEKRMLGRARRTMKSNIELDLKYIGWEDVDRINFAQNRDRWWAFVNMVMNLRVH